MKSGVRGLWSGKGGMDKHHKPQTIDHKPQTIDHKPPSLFPQRIYWILCSRFPTLQTNDDKHQTQDQARCSQKA